MKLGRLLLNWKIAFELEDLKKDKEKRREKMGEFSFWETNLGLEG